MVNMPHPKYLYEKVRWRKVIRKQVLLDADYRCARCNTDLYSTAYMAHVHHIIPTTHAPELVYDPFNLEALCLHCHNREHGRGKYGCAEDGTPLDPDHPWNCSTISGG